MSATAAMLSRLRRMVNEPTPDVYDDTVLREYIERYPLLDVRGKNPYTWDTSTEPPTQDANESWIPTYDLHAAAANIWSEKAALVAGDFDFASDGSNLSRSQVVEQYMKQMRHHRSRCAITVIEPLASPLPAEDVRVWIGNLPEPDD